MTHPWYQRPADIVVPASWKLDDGAAEDLLDFVWAMVLRGLDETYYYVDAVEHQLRGVDRADITAWFDGLLERRRRQQRELGGRPASKLSAAFAELDTAGVISRENFTCCNTCLCDEIWDQLDGSRHCSGYFAYHQQDTERILASRRTAVSHGLFLPAFTDTREYWKLSPDDRERRYAEFTTAWLRGEVFPILTKHGIGVDWNGSADSRVYLTDVDFFAEV